MSNSDILSSIQNFVNTFLFLIVSLLNEFSAKAVF
nr:MAG TPA: hypothetical protein [Caudoviricetes sp.]